MKNNIQLRNYAVASICILLFLVGISYIADSILPEGSPNGVYASEVNKDETGEDVDAGQDGTSEEPPADDGADAAAEDGTDADAAYGIAGSITVPKLYDGLNVSLNDIYINRQLQVVMEGCPKGAYNEGMVTCDSGIVTEVQVEEQESGDTVINMALDGVYDYELREEEAAYVITARDVHSVYDKVIVVDAGHGGKDIGCSSRDSRYYEKEYTMIIAMLLKEKLDTTDIKVYYTRLGDETVYLRPRITLGNDVRADMFVSLHFNAYEYYWIYDVKGAETLYSSRNKRVRRESRRLAEIMLDNLVENTGLEKRKAVDRKKSVYILKESKVPATIIEIAYMSHEGDMKLLLKPSKQRKIAEGIFDGIVSAYSEMYGKTVETR